MITSCLHGLWLDILNRKIIVLKVTEKIWNQNKDKKGFGILICSAIQPKGIDMFSHKNGDFVQIGIDAEDYYRIKDAKSNE